MTTAPPTTAPAPTAEESDDGRFRPLTTEQLDLLIGTSRWGFVTDFAIADLCAAYGELVAALEHERLAHADILGDEIDAKRETVRHEAWLDGWRDRFTDALLLDAQVCREKGRRGVYVSAWEHDLPGAPARPGKEAGR